MLLARKAPMLNPTILNEKPAAASIRDRLNLVSTAMPRPRQRTMTNDFVPDRAAPFKLR